MTDAMKPEDLDRALFSGLIMMLSTSAMQQLGKLVDPSTRQAAVSLEAAQMTIDILEMLQRRTKGNLDAEEARLLNDILSSLQMNFVQVAAAAPADAKAADAPPAAEPSAPAGEAVPPPAGAKGGGDDKTPKYRKSYGP